ARLLGGPPEVLLVAAQPEPAHLQAAQRLLERLAEGPADGHHLADRLHLGREDRVGVGELLERPAGDLGDDVVDRRLEAGGGAACVGGRRGGGGGVLGWGFSASGWPRGGWAAFLASGTRVALLAGALERLPRGFISMTITRPVGGSRANWTFDPPVSTPMAR